jgi:outer membrane protein OmpA-like peptidoglycan-associated protein
VKKAYILAALFIMIFTLVGCGGGGGGGSHEDDQNVDIRSEVNDFLDQFCVNNVSGNINGIIGAFDFSLISALAPEFPATAAKTPAFTESQRQAALKQDNSDALLTQRLTITFATGTSQLTGEGKAALDVFADTVKLMNGVVIQVEGNTDNVGNPESNKTLSLQRAMAVKMYLQYQHNIDPSRFNVIGNGQDKPVMDNSTSDGKAANRRTDVYLKVVQ